MWSHSEGGDHLSDHHQKADSYSWVLVLWKSAKHKLPAFWHRGAAQILHQTVVLLALHCWHFIKRWWPAFFAPCRSGIFSSDSKCLVKSACSQRFEVFNQHFRAFLAFFAGWLVYSEWGDCKKPVRLTHPWPSHSAARARAIAMRNSKCVYSTGSPAAVLVAL